MIDNNRKAYLRDGSETLMLNQVITAKEAAALIGVSQRQVLNMCKAGKLEARYADGVWLVLKNSIGADNK